MIPVCQWRFVGWVLLRARGIHRKPARGADFVQPLCVIEGQQRGGGWAGSHTQPESVRAVQIMVRVLVFRGLLACRLLSLLCNCGYPGMIFFLAPDCQSQSSARLAPDHPEATQDPQECRTWSITSSSMYYRFCRQHCTLLHCAVGCSCFKMEVCQDASRGGHWGS